MIYKAVKFVCLALLVILPVTASMAQNTKGDSPSPRESRFKTPGKKQKKARSSRRARMRQERADPNTAVTPLRRPRGERVGKPIRPLFQKSQPRDRQRAWKGDITGRRIQPRTTRRAREVHPQPPTTNYSSLSQRRSGRDNENPNVRRVRRMQRRADHTPRVGRPIRPTFHKTRPQRQERAWIGDITGRPIRTQPPGRTRVGASQRAGGFSGTLRPRGERRTKLLPRTWGRAKNVFSQRSFYVNNQSYRRPPRAARQRASILGMFRQPDAAGGRKARIIPRSATSGFFRRRSINTWAHFPRQRRKGERAITTDLAGHPLRMRNFETQRPELINPTLQFRRRVPGGDRAYKGPGGGYSSRSQGGKAWKGDIAHRKIRGGFRSKKGEPKAGVALGGLRPGRDARRAGRFQGNMRARRGFNDQGAGYTGNIKARRGFRDQGEGYTGNIKARRGFRDQGEGYTGNIKARRGYHDQGEGYTGNIRVGQRGFRDQGEGYTGNIRSRRPDQGGGSISGSWNNKGRPIATRVPRKEALGIARYSGNIRVRREFQDQGEGYSGNIRTRRPEKGGGSISGSWNNKGQPIANRIYSDHHKINRFSGNMRLRRQFQDQGEEYTGNIKARRPEKGGGSISGSWNNKGRPIATRVPRKEALQVSRYTGNMRITRTFQDQGEEYTGNIKTRRPKKGGGSISGSWNNKGQPIANRIYPDHHKISGYSGNIRATRPEKGGGSVSGSWNNRGRPIEPRSYPNHSAINRYSGNIRAGDREPDVRRYERAPLGTVTIKQGKYVRNPNAASDALRVRKPDPAYDKATRYSGRMRRDWDYVRSPSSADEALKVREPGRAFFRATAYQGNIKVKRFELFGKGELHPDARFVRTNKNNVSGERDMMTNFKLWWARLFKKGDTQPAHLKEKDKDRKPRYDKGEQGMWYD